MRMRSQQAGEFAENLKYGHVFAIVRVDTFFRPDVEPQTAITVKTVAWTREAAEAEVARLNRLNGDKGTVYFWQVTRLEAKAGQGRTA